MFGGALPGDVREQSRGAEDRDDLDGIVAQAIDNAEWADDQLSELRLTALGNDSPRFWELLQTIGCADEALHHEVGIQWGILSDVGVNRLEVPNRPR